MCIQNILVDKTLIETYVPIRFQQKWGVGREIFQVHKPKMKQPKIKPVKAQRMVTKLGFCVL